MSDHFSGPRALAGPVGDICDLFAFPSPERPGRLVLAMTVLPRATPGSTFSDAVVCLYESVAATGLPSRRNEYCASMRTDSGAPDLLSRTTSPST